MSFALETGEQAPCVAGMRTSATRGGGGGGTAALANIHSVQMPQTLAINCSASLSQLTMTGVSDPNFPRKKETMTYN